MTADDNREILSDVDAKVLETGAGAAVASVGDGEAVGLALLLAGEVGEVVEQVVRRRVFLLRPPHRANSLRVWVDRWVGFIWRESYILKAGVQTLQTVLTFLQRDCLKS